MEPGRLQERAVVWAVARQGRLQTLIFELQKLQLLVAAFAEPTLLGVLIHAVKVVADLDVGEFTTRVNERRLVLDRGDRDVAVLPEVFVLGSFTVLLLRDQNQGMMILGKLVLVQLSDHDLWLGGRALRGIARLIRRLSLRLTLLLLGDRCLGLLWLLGWLGLAVGNQHGRGAVRLFILLV